MSAAGVRSAVETTRVWFAVMTAEDISWYVGTGEPMDRAGSYAIQGIGVAIYPSDRRLVQQRCRVYRGHGL